MRVASVATELHKTQKNALITVINIFFILSRDHRQHLHRAIVLCFYLLPLSKTNTNLGILPQQYRSFIKIMVNGSTLLDRDHEPCYSLLSINLSAAPISMPSNNNYFCNQFHDLRRPKWKTRYINTYCHRSIKIASQLIVSAGGLWFALPLEKSVDIDLLLRIKCAHWAFSSTTSSPLNTCVGNYRRLGWADAYEGMDDEQSRSSTSVKLYFSLSETATVTDSPCRSSKYCDQNRGREDAMQCILCKVPRGHCQPLLMCEFSRFRSSNM